MNGAEPAGDQDRVAHLEAAIPAAALRAEDAWWPRPVPAGGGFRLTVGARPADPATWLRPRPLDAAILRWRVALLDREGSAAFDVLPGEQEAGEVVLALVRQATAGTAAPGPAAPDRGPDGLHPLDRAGREVAEDLCLVRLQDGVPVLVGASLAMPNRWRLADKLGRPMAGVHTPVPGYASALRSSVDRFLTGLREGRVMTRSNWAITDDPRLYQPASDSRARRPGSLRTARQAADELHVRVEHQTLRRLPAPARDRVLFTIRTAHEPLAALADRPGIAGGLAATIAAMPEPDLDYKGVLPYRQPVLELLHGFAASRA